jgi:hypothetical protein
LQGKFGSPYKNFLSRKTMTRGKKERPAGLAAFIAAANMKEPLADFASQFPGRIVDLAEVAASLPSAILDFLREADDQEEFRNRYDSLRSGQRVLPSLVDSFSDYQPGSFSSIPEAVPVNLYLHNGRVGASGYMVNVLKDLPVKGVLRCEMCGLIFAPQRSNSECCSLKCRNRLNKRKSRRAQKNLMEGKLSDGTL